MNADQATADFPDPHFGTDEVMLSWCERESLTPVKDADGNWDWIAVWVAYMKRNADSGCSGWSVRPP